ncbi:DUF6980 family protein [Methylovorus glucosotrophus]|uniref:DUF6980 family protein n=1 Tax=Methylovorus glucosotrophus TaxID=266009 RepID=UPI00133169B8|nr:hypothetical protein [Methylovorus glucosotrophus]
MDYKKDKHCCQNMSVHLARGELSIRYTPKFREYGILYKNENSIQQISFCPWCGTKLPSTLRELWFEQLDELGIEPEDDIPDEYNSDEWWKRMAGL